MINAAIKGIWSLVSVLAVVSNFVPFLKQFTVHGKLNQHGQVPYSVSKANFKWFYVTGFIVHVAAYFIFTVNNSTMGIILIHLTRRIYECFCIVEFGASRMSIAAVGLGLGHYIGLCLSLVMDEICNAYWTYPSVLLFVYASYHQYKCNRIVSKLKKEAGYGMPHGDWYDVVICPLYLAEILIYVAFWWSAGLSGNLGFVLLWVITNQSISGYQSLNWYSARYKNKVENRWVMVPYVW